MLKFKDGEPHVGALPSPSAVAPKKVSKQLRKACLSANWCISNVSKAVFVLPTILSMHKGHV